MTGDPFPPMKLFNSVYLRSSRWHSSHWPWPGHHSWFDKTHRPQKHTSPRVFHHHQTQDRRRNHRGRLQCHCRTRCGRPECRCVVRQHRGTKPSLADNGLAKVPGVSILQTRTCSCRYTRHRCGRCRIVSLCMTMIWQMEPTVVQRREKQHAYGREL